MSARELAGYKTAIENVFRYDNTDRPITDPEELKAMRLIYKQPKEFRPIYGSEWFQDNPRLKSTFSCIGHQLRSMDDRFIVFFPPGATIYTPEFENRMNTIFPSGQRELAVKRIFRYKD